MRRATLLLVVTCAALVLASGVALAARRQGSGNDQAYGAGRDTLEGESGADEVSGDNGQAAVNGGTREDTLSGGSGPDTMDGGGE